MITTSETTRQRQLNRLYGDWYEFAKKEYDAGKTIPEIVDFWKAHDRIDVGISTLYAWMTERDPEWRHSPKAEAA